MRGEDRPILGRPSNIPGSPPHARGRRPRPPSSPHARRITPACAGKTLSASSPKSRKQGSPPHARGRLSFVFFLVLDAGITPACAGKTRRKGTRHRGIRDHPRMRGEDKLNALGLPRRTGSPPHARGRLENDAGRAAAGGITPACAGKTPFSSLFNSCSSDHPRMRGEDLTNGANLDEYTGSPPHARGRQPEIETVFDQGRITPACAGKTALPADRSEGNGDHPRMRGEDVQSVLQSGEIRGSPPHARGRQLDSPGNTAKSFPSLPVFFCSQPSPLGWFLRWVLGLGSSLWKQR